MWNAWYCVIDTGYDKGTAVIFMVSGTVLLNTKKKQIFRNQHEILCPKNMNSLKCKSTCTT